ncbi:MAG: hypothetical protein JWR89_3872, partial [Tardiphaga sp.]|nr:hypothetical protein [Tardiphaga sp.]
MLSVAIRRLDTTFDTSRFLNSTVFSGRAWRIALVAVAGLAGTVSAEAAVFWSDDDPMMMSQPMPLEPQPRPRKPKRAGPRIEKPIKETARPVGPLVIAISIDRQTLKIYDANGLYAESPVSTGMKGHSTPMGVFSVIQKNKYHKSNIYSGAPMPFMQRITWSGIAMHAGALPGYPASHGCIRLPMAFATKMWSWTRMGARVVITPGEVAPSDIAHPLLVARKAEPVAAAPTKDVAPLARAMRVAAPAMSSASLDLKPSMETPAARTAETRRDQTQTADASATMIPMAKSPVVSDASLAKPADAVRVTRRDVDEAAARTVELPPVLDVKPA